MVARQHDDVILSDTDENLQNPKMHLCGSFGRSTCDCVGGVCGQKKIQFVDYNKNLGNISMPAYSPFINPSSNCTVCNLKHYNNKLLSVIQFSYPRSTCSTHGQPECKQHCS